MFFIVFPRYGGAYDGEQTWPRQALLSLDKPDLLEVRAPKATQVLLTTEDNCFPYRGGQAAVEEAAPAFEALLGATPPLSSTAPEAAAVATKAAAVGLEVHTAVYHHGWQQSNREAMYSFFLRSLAPSVAKENDSTEWWPSGVGNLTGLFQPEQLQVTSTGQVASAPECAPNLIYHNFTAEITKNNVAKLQAQRGTAGTGTAFLGKIRAVAGEVVGYKSPVTKQLAASNQATNPYHLAKDTRVANNKSKMTDPVTVGGGGVLTAEATIIPGEGHCKLTLTSSGAARVAKVGSASAGASQITYPQQRVVLLVGSSPQPAVVKALVAGGYSTVELQPCGFGADPAFPKVYV